MRLCRFMLDERIVAGFYHDEFVIPLSSAAELYARRHGHGLGVVQSDDLLDYLPPDGAMREAAATLHDWIVLQDRAPLAQVCIDRRLVRLMVPVPQARKLLLLAGNYAEHVREDGSRFEEREHTFPYVFMKPPSTTLLDPGSDLVLPVVSPDHLDWEVELACVIGVTARQVPPGEALGCIAGYTVLNDISDRRFRPNPHRKPRDWDKFFDWMHGKWHDGSAPCGPCIASSRAIPDPQVLGLSLTLNDEVRQRGSTAEQIFPLAQVVSFISRFVTLERGDIISTGTPAGVGATSGTYLKPGDVMVASVTGIGELVTRVAAGHEK